MQGGKKQVRAAAVPARTAARGARRQQGRRHPARPHHFAGLLATGTGLSPSLSGTTRLNTGLSAVESRSTTK